MDAKHGMMDGVEESLGSFSSPLDDSRGSSSPSSELTEDTASSGPSSPSCLPTSTCGGPPFEMSSLKEQLPNFKRGLSKHYQGKSQSFTSFSNINCLEDLAKLERPLKKLKSSKSCRERLDNRKSLPLRCCQKRTITKKTSKGCFSSSNVSARRNCLLGSKPPLYPHGNGNLSDKTLWFA